MAAPLFNTPDRIITTAMRVSGLLQKGEVPDATDYADYLPRLVDLVNLWQTQGLKLWLNSIVVIPLTAGQALYSLGPAASYLTTKPMRVLEAYYVLTSGNSYPLSSLAWVDYNLLANTLQQGALNSYFVDKQQTNQVVAFYMVPNAAAASGGNIELLVQKATTNFATVNDTLNFPQEWYIALYWGLAAEIGNGQSDKVINRCKMNAEQYRTFLEDWDVEDVSTIFSPTGLIAGGNSFR